MQEGGVDGSWRLGSAAIEMQGVCTVILSHSDAAYISRSLSVSIGFIR